MAFSLFFIAAALIVLGALLFISPIPVVGKAGGIKLILLGTGLLLANSIISTLNDNPWVLGGVLIVALFIMVKR